MRKRTVIGEEPDESRTMRDESLTFTLRLPASLARELDQIAARNHRSRTAEITVALERYVEGSER